MSKHLYVGLQGHEVSWMLSDETDLDELRTHLSSARRQDRETKVVVRIGSISRAITMWPATFAYWAVEEEEDVVPRIF